MATIQQSIAEKFLARLAKSKTFDAAVIEQLGTLLKGKKVRSDDLIRAFTSPTDTDVK
jgi:hypothetical protein